MPRSDSGRRRFASKAGFATEGAARRALNRVLVDIDDGTHVDRNDITVGEYLGDWIERAALDPGSKRHVTAYLERLTKAFHQALTNAQRGGEIDVAADLDELSGFFTTALIGVAASIRAEAPPEQISAACRVAITVLDAHRPIAVG